MSAVAVQRRDRLDARAVGLMVFLCALWGLQQVTVKLAVLHGLPPVLQAGVRGLVASALVLAWTAWRDGSREAAALLRADRSLRAGLLLGAAFTAEFAILYPGLALTSASRGVLFLYTAPFFTALGAHLLLADDRLSRTKALGLLIAFGGVALAFADGLADAHGSLRGDALCLGGAMLWATSTLIIKRSPDLGSARPARVLLYQLGVSVPVLLAISVGLGEWRSLTWPEPIAWLCLFYQSVIVAFASYLAWFWLVLTYPASRLAPFTFLAPMFGVGFGALLLGEAIGLGLVAGLIAVAVGLRLLNARG